MYSFKVHQSIVEQRKSTFTEGRRVVLDKMDGENLPIGLMGTVAGVDDIGTIFVNWDNGSRLGVVYGADECHIV